MSNNLYTSIMLGLVLIVSWGLNLAGYEHDLSNLVSGVLGAQIGLWAYYKWIKTND